MSKENNNKNKKENNIQYIPIFMCLGTSVGMGIGLIFNNIGVGMCLGVGLGVAFGALLDLKNKNTDGNNKNDKNNK